MFISIYFSGIVKTSAVRSSADGSSVKMVAEYGATNSSK